MTAGKVTLHLFISLFLCLPYTARGDELKPRPSPVLDKLLKKYGLKSSHVSYSLIPITEKGGQNDVVFRETVPMIPASITKIPTVWGALKTLGEDKKFHTDVWTSDSEIKEGVLQGDLYLVGGGDPFLTYADFSNLILKLKSRGIKKIKGDFYFDQSHFPVKKKISDLGEGDETYNPSVSPLSLEFNQFTAYEKNRHDWTAIPPFDVFEFKTTDDNFSEGRSFRYLKGFSKTHKKEAWAFSTKKNYRNKENLPVRNPGRVAASAFRWMSSLWGVELPQAKQKTAKTSNLNLLGRAHSKPLKDLAYSVMEYSNNLFAESLLLHFAQGKGVQEPKLTQAGDLLVKDIKKEFGKEKFEDWVIINGSGLTVKNRMTTESLSFMLKKLHTENFGEVTFPGLFSFSGNNGSIRGRLDNPQEALRVWAKTGSLDYVNNLAGYLFSRSGNAYAFSIFVNDKKKRRIVSDSDNPNSRRLARKAGQWHSRSRNLIDELLRHWLETK